MPKPVRFISRTVWYIVMLVFSFIMLYPFIFSMLAGLNTIDEFGHLGALFPVPQNPQFDNLLFLFTPRGIRPLINTFTRTAWYTVVVCTISVLMGYVLARYTFKGKRVFLVSILAVQVIPAVLTLIPAFVMMSHIPFVGGNNWMGMGGRGLINNSLALYLPLGWGFLIWTFLFMQSMKSLPRDFEEAGELDGCGFWRKIFQVIIPLQRPMIAVIGVNVALSVWNDWLIPFLYIRDTQRNTLPAYLGALVSALQQFGERDYPRIFAMSTIAIIPPFLIFLFLQKYIIQGIASAGVKG
ncbi:MAG: carbohydrate ABC transporter permease [Defluviitaleaceae bacterium]|nr:carbohydrate ABC transporter permease [Defluviitaleaceae bacterium]MCL2240264.1 carbohydrate ABC transporter permease [Defluviitaleaceae bacterium]